MNKILSLRELKQTIYLLIILSLVLFVPSYVTAQHGSQVATGTIGISITVIGNNPSGSIGSGVDHFSKLFNSDSSLQNLDGEIPTDVRFDNNLSTISNYSISTQTESGEKILEEMVIENRLVNQSVGTSTILDTQGRLYIHQQQGSDISSATKNKSQQLHNGLIVVAVNE